MVVTSKIPGIYNNLMKYILYDGSQYYFISTLINILYLSECSYNKRGEEMLNQKRKAI